MVTLEGSWGPSGQSEAVHPRTGIHGRGCPVGISGPGPAPCHACHRRERFSGAWGSGSLQTLLCIRRVRPVLAAGFQASALVPSLFPSLAHLPSRVSLVLKRSGLK